MLRTEQYVVAGARAVLRSPALLTEVFDEDGDFLSTSFATITNRYLLAGLDGREIRYAFVSAFTPGAETLTLPAVMSETVAADGTVGAATQTRERTLGVRGARTSRIRATFDVIDNLGHIHQPTAHGQVDLLAGSPVDGQIVSHIEPELVNDAAWIWRTGRTHLTGHDLLGSAQDTTNHYDPVTGDLLRATQVVNRPGLPAYDFAAPGLYEPTLVNEDLVASTAYDPWATRRGAAAARIF